MRGWKVVYSEDEGILEVGPTRGTPRVVYIVGIGTSPREDHHYLLYELDPDDDELGEKAEDAVREYLGQQQGGDWDLVEARILSPHWEDMSGHERDRLMRREGFDATRRIG